MSPITEPLTAAGPEHEPGLAAWRARSLSVRAGGEWTTLRLVRFANGWLASADTVEGPTLGCDASPYLAARRALEPLGVGLLAAMAAVADVLAERVHRVHQRHGRSHPASEGPQ